LEERGELMIYNIFFYLFCSILILSAGAAVRTRNVVHSILFFMLLALSSSALMLLIGAEFFSIFSLTVYSGMLGILVFFVYNFDFNKKIERKFNKKEILLTGIAILIFSVEILIVIYFTFKEKKLSSMELDKAFSLEGIKTLLQNISFLLFDIYSYNLRLCGVILFVGIISSLLIMRRKNILREVRKKK
jgi:NADH:ubiquinone oxidoreductase subunit 6 (subunit J)